jgi:anaerobic selenocysteine-containing dehydrogenase
MTWPSLYLHEADARQLGLADGYEAQVTANGRQVQATIHVNGQTPAGVAILRGVPYIPGAVAFEVSSNQRVGIQ